MWISTVPILVPLARLGDPRVVVQILGAMEHHPDDHGVLRATLDLLEATLREQLSSDDFDPLFAIGATLGITALVEQLLQVIDDALA